MQWLLLVLLIFISGCGACDPDSLGIVCPLHQECIILNDGKVKVREARWDWRINEGQCQNGLIVSCESDGTPICEGFVGTSTESCDNIDNDCDGQIDEGFDFDTDGWTTCAGDCDDNNYKTFPTALEICDNIDNNCDGQIDEDLLTECWTGANNVVFGENSQCRKGTKACAGGGWQDCRDQVRPSIEQCDGIDNDCDGIIDEDEPDICGSFDEVGICNKGTRHCIAGEAVCLDAVFPDNEICDNLDNDCDGLTDEGLTSSCQTQCGLGLATCFAGEWINCNAPFPTPEVCDGLDNDCDGQVDEDCPCPHGEARTCIKDIISPVDGSTITCGLGTEVCDTGVWGPCYYYSTGPEACNNHDDDCDGIIDEIIDPRCGISSDKIGVGVCQAGTSTCSGGIWSTCEGAVVPTKERCDGLDNDCDNLVDEDLDPHDKVDFCFVIDGSGSMTEEMVALRSAISMYVGDFIGTEHKFCLVVFPGTGQNPWELFIPLTDIVSFQAQLSLLAANWGGNEPSYDAMYDITLWNDPMNIGWRTATGTVTGAYPYIIMITDEGAQSWYGRTEFDVASNTVACYVGECIAPDKFEVFVITNQSFFLQWDSVVFGDQNRLVNLQPPDGQRYRAIFFGFFSNVCLPQN